MSRDAKHIFKEQKCTIFEEILRSFLDQYPILKEFKIMMPNKNKNIFDALKGYVGLYTLAFT